MRPALGSPEVASVCLPSKKEAVCSGHSHWPVLGPTPGSGPIPLPSKALTLGKYVPALCPRSLFCKVYSTRRVVGELSELFNEMI